MLTKLAKLLLVLAFAAGAQFAHAFVDPPVLVPPNPVAGQTVSINIRAGVCDLFTTDPPTITRSSNSIHMVLQSASSPDPTFCNYPTGTYAFVVGVFDAGSYSLQVDRVYIGNDGPVTATLGILSFTVTAPASAPALDLFGIITLALTLLVAAALALRRGGLGVVLLAAALAPIGARAQSAPPQNPSLEVLVSSASAADQIVAYFSASNRGSISPPLQSLAVESPQTAGYLLPIRAKGDFLTYLQNNPTSTRAKLERYLLIRYPQTANLQTAMSALRGDPGVEAAYLPATGARFSSAQLTGFTVTSSSPAAGPVSSGPQYGRDDLNVDAAWQVAGGYALVGDVDSGIYPAHPALMQFASNGQYLGGNFVPASSVNLGFAGIYPYLNTWTDLNVDEGYPLLLPPNTPCNHSNQTQSVPALYAGHGTHVSGLIGANPSSTFGVKGTCLHCGIAMWKVTYPVCSSLDGIVYQGYNRSQVGPAITYLSDIGAQVINLSLGDPTIAAGYCANNPNESWCAALTTAFYRDVTIVASAGNSRTVLQFPANDIRTLDAGGFDQNVALWDLSPPRPNTANCPSPNLTGENLGDECGSNFAVIGGDPPQELMASANQALSTTYPGKNWDLFSCGDGYPGPGWGNGKGLCTGTSMSAPQISGVVGILRSINPLVGTSVPNPNLGQTVGIRTVLARTTFEAQANPASYFTSTFGYGHPDAAAAARMMMGRVAGRQVLNRVTPLFRLYSSAAQDYADTTSPQFATALLISAAAAYQPQGSSTPGYTSFPPAEPGQPALPAPKAAAYVLTTEYKPWPNSPVLLPLYLLDRTRNWPLGCTTGSPGCNSHRDFLLLTTTADIQQAHTDGFNLRTIQGYIYQTCSPEPTCIPSGAQKFYRECNTTIDDCATFLESERTTFEGNGYTGAYPATSSKVLGYAYPGTDSDGDGLIDGLEYVIGTDPFLADSDGNGQSDGLAYPMAGVPVSDPCLGPGAINCPANFIFKNGFEL